MFLAYDKVHFSQHALYQEYEAMTPGIASKDVAFDIFWSNIDEKVQAVNDALKAAKFADGAIPIEYYLFAVLAAEGELFDVYLLDEDKLFVSLSAGVAADDVVTVGTSMVKEVSDPIREVWARREAQDAAQRAASKKLKLKHKRH